MKDPSAGKQRIIPDGCIEMIFMAVTCSDSTMRAGILLSSQGMLFRAGNVPLLIEPSGTKGIFAVCFFPEGFAPFATTAITDLANKAT